MSLHNETAVSHSFVKATLYTVPDRFPLAGAGDNETHLGFEVWLVKHREDPVAIKGFKLGVQVLVSVAAVRVGVKTDSVVVVLVQVSKLDGVPPLLQIRRVQVHSLSLEAVLPFGLAIIDTKVCDRQRAKV